jgi:predicted SAM-dependent methyltransferase
MIKLNLGCGSVRPNGWINTDSSLNANFQRIPIIGKSIAKIVSNVSYESQNLIYMNLNNNWKRKDATVDVVYASHLFEHLSLKSADLFLKNAYRCLKPGGVIRIVVPDLYQIVKKYTLEYDEMEHGDPTEYIMWAINMHREGQYGTPSFFKKIIHEIQGYPHQHKFMYDDKSLIFKMEAYGFKELKSMSYGSSNLIREIKDVEGSKESYLSVYIEGIKL